MWSTTGSVFAIYWLFILVVAFRPEWLAKTLSVGSAVSVGIPVAALVVVLSWLVTGWYVYVSGSRLDALSATLLKECAR
ncbi:DUF485 domain-containing protein [Paraburkholderia sp. BL21I4N1]|uniref:DUF485 domain-containing protein n=1 Tax=Paraburkholderia sp. BL21I4N1 TaxID=1938801 RepID=UPI0035BE5C0F